MNIAIIGYGKMGKAIEEIAQSRGHQISFKLSEDNLDEFDKMMSQNTDVAIEFTQPEAAVRNISKCLKKGIPIVSGTTGWLDKFADIETLCEVHKGAFFYASNFSIGVNLFFLMNEQVAKLMNNYPEYNVELHEIHHTEKKDAPSGTAITLAEGIMQEIPRKTKWVNEAALKPEEVSIISLRQAGVPGTHLIRYLSEIDHIELKHTALSRKGFATGAVLASEWLLNKKGVFGMRDMLNF